MLIMECLSRADNHGGFVQVKWRVTAWARSTPTHQPYALGRWALTFAVCCLVTGTWRWPPSLGTPATRHFSLFNRATSNGWSSDMFACITVSCVTDSYGWVRRGVTGGRPIPMAACSLLAGWLAWVWLAWWGGYRDPWQTPYLQYTCTCW